MAERINRGRLDTAVTVVRPHHARVTPEVMAVERYLMILPLDHQRAGASRILPEALPEIDRFFIARRVRPRLVLKTASDRRALGVVRAGQGISMMRESLADCGVSMVLIVDFNLTRDIGRIYFSKHVPAAERSSPFLELIRRHYAKE